MMAPNLPEIIAAPEVTEILRQACQPPDALPDLERQAAAGEALAPFAAQESWRSFADAVRETWRARDHVIVRGLPALAEGASLLLASLALAGGFKTYRGGKIVKTFRMSPWTTDLSHTIREGSFHTDLNTDPQPPAVTAIQCLTPDPGAPRFGTNRVALARDLLAHLEAQGREDILRFLRTAPVTMVNDRSLDSWTGPIIEEDRIRFHPETIRAAAQRLQTQDPETETCLSALHEAALAVSVPFWLEAGDILFVSNHRALHYRGECSVTFLNFPLEFQSRAIHVLHKLSEPR